jgi:hypothetical protein
MEAAAASEVSTATKTATMEAATTKVTAPATKTATVASATTAKSTSTSAAAVPSRPRGLTEGKQTEANHAKYSFCFHILSSREPLVATIAHPLDFVVPPKMYRPLPLRSASKP